MKFIKSFFSLTVVSSASCLAAENSSTVKLGFNKLYGNSFQKATADKRHVNNKNKSGSNDDDEISLENNQNTYYSVDIAIGTPPQNISVQLDTGSSDLWLIEPGALQCPSDSFSYFDLPKQTSNSATASSYISEEFQQYESIILSEFDNLPFGPPTGTISVLGPLPTFNGTSGFGSNDCNSTAYFDPSKSKTFKRNHTDPYYIQYEDLTYASGFWGTDDLAMGQLKVHNMSLAVANKTNSTSPVFGIGFSGDESSFASLGPDQRAAHPHKYANFPELLKDQGIIQRVAYSLYLNSPNATDGNVLFGGVDKSQYKGQLYSFPVLKLGDLTDDGDPYNTLAITLNNVSVSIKGSEHTISTKGFPAVLDSGTTAMYLPYQVADLIASKFNGIYSSGLGYVIECPDTKDTINFGFGPVTIETDINNYVFQEGDQCVLSIFPSEDILCILGDVFLVDAYVVYDLEGKQIALAQASFDSSKEDIEPITSSGIPGAKQAPKDSGSEKKLFGH